MGRILLPQLITPHQANLTRISGLSQGFQFEIYPTTTDKLKIILFEVDESAIYDAFSPKHYIFTKEDAFKRVLSKKAAYDLAMKNLEILPHHLAQHNSGAFWNLRATESPVRADSYEAVRCFCKPLMDKLVSPTKRYVTFPNLNVPFIFHEDCPLELVQEGLNRTFDKSDELHLSSDVFILENGVVRDI